MNYSRKDIQLISEIYDTMLDHNMVLTEGVKEMILAGLLAISGITGAMGEQSAPHPAPQEKAKIEQSVQAATDVNTLKKIALRIVQQRIRLIQQSMPAGVKVPSFIMAENQTLIKELTTLSDSITNASNPQQLASILQSGDISSRDIESRRSHDNIMDNLKAIRDGISSMEVK
jgi:hypothetical protein